MMDIAIIAGVRTAFTRAFKGAFKDTRPEELGIVVLQEVLRQSGITKEEIEDVILGCAMPEGEQGLNIARLIALGAGFPVEVPGMTINRFCASGLQSIIILADRISSGQMSVGIAGGVESMSMVPMTGNKISLSPTIVDKIPEAYMPMGVTAENVARRFKISRQIQDEFSLRSHQKAIMAREQGFFKEEIIPFVLKEIDASKKEKEQKVDTDEGPRQDTTIEKLSLLPPAFDPTGTITAGNSSPLTDGAAAVLLMSHPLAKQRGLSPLGLIRAFAVVGVSPEIMGIGPVPAVKKLLFQAGLSVKDIDLFELNEAFASQAVYCVKELNIPDEKLNVNGGAIALGHPLGVTGTRLTITLLRELRRRKGRYGIVTMCVGGGIGAAALIEAV